MTDQWRAEILRLYDQHAPVNANPEPEPADEDCDDKCIQIFWIKVAFIIVCFLQGLCTGFIPTWSESCRTSPKILGIANAFAAGVFLAIALLHILPEEIKGWGEYSGAE